MNPSSREEGDQKSFPGFGLPHSFHPLRGAPSVQHSIEEKPVRVKRRRTRRERDSVKFGKNGTDQAAKQRSSCRGPQKMMPPFWRSQLRNCTQLTPIRGACGVKPVIITQNRLTQQHLGIFNRKVTSADIERLLTPKTEQEVIMEVTPICKDNSAEKLQEEQVQSHKACEAATHKSLPAEPFRCTGKDLRGVNNEDSLCDTPLSGTEAHQVAGVEAVEAGSQPFVAPAVLELSPQARETNVFQSNTSVVLNEKENVPLALMAKGAKPAKGRSLVKELAQGPQRLLDLKAMFPGRNVISETRQAVFSVLGEQKKTLPELSALASLKKLAIGYKRGTSHADFKSLSSRDQEDFGLELKSNICSNKNSDQVIPLKERRGREKLFLACFSPSPVHREIAMNMNPSRISFVSEEQCPKHEAFFRTSQHWKQRSAEALWGPRGRQERAEVVPKRVWPTKQVSGRCSLPFTAHDSLGSSSLSVNGNGSDSFLLTDPQQYSCVSELSPDVWKLHGMEPVPVHSLHPSQELCNSQLLDLGLRNTERAPTESQTSFDVLKSIWSPKLPRKGPRLPGPQPQAYPHWAFQLPSSKELNLEQGQSKEFLQLYSITPEQHCTSYKQNPQQEATVSSRLPRHGDDLFSALAKPKVYCQKVSVEPGRTSESYPVWGLVEALEKIQGTREKSGSSRSESQTGDMERLLQHVGAQQLQFFKQLPMSYFPPSEALEESRKLPLCTLQGHLPGQASPEPWSFPRMKLY